MNSLPPYVLSGLAYPLAQDYWDTSFAKYSLKEEKITLHKKKSIFPLEFKLRALPTEGKRKISSSLQTVVFYGCYNKLSQTWWLKTQVYLSYCSEGQKSEISFIRLKSSCGQTSISLKATYISILTHGPFIIKASRVGLSLTSASTIFYSWSTPDILLIWWNYCFW